MTPQLVRPVDSRPGKGAKGERVDDRLLQRACGVEAEFTLLVDDRPARPEDVFGDPRGFITVPLMHRTGRSFHLPNGCAIYFDTGVIEIASPVMELARGSFGRLARSLDTAIRFVREHLDAWEQRSGRRARLQGFSAHYNVSVEDREATATASHAVTRNRELAWLLMHVLPTPVMLLGTNRLSTGVGVRPRPHRIEVTADFAPDPARLAATGTLIGGVVTAMDGWSDLRVAQLPARRIPMLTAFHPRRHSSRRGWVARPACFAADPFAVPPDRCLLPTSDGDLSVRAIARRVFQAFRHPIARLADPFTYRTIRRLLDGADACWLDQDERPAAYDNVGRQGALERALAALGASRYERVLLNAIASKSLEWNGEPWTPVGIRGWSRVVFRRDRDGARTVLPLDALVPHLERW